MAKPRQPEAVYYLTRADLVRCHAAAPEVAESTARHHMLHTDGLMAALERPRWHAHYRKADLGDQAAVLAQGRVASHACVDGNKRTTWVALRTFLEVTGYPPRTRPAVRDAVEQMTGLTTRRLTASEFASWPRRR